MLDREADLCLAQPSSKKLYLAVDGYKDRDPQPAKTQKIRDPETFSLKALCSASN